MKKKITTLALVISVMFTYAQFPNADFSVIYGYLFGSNATFGTATDDDFGGFVEDGNGYGYAIHANKTINVNQSDVIITKLHLESGTVIWSKKYGMSSRGEALLEPAGNGITVGGAGTSYIDYYDGALYFTCSIYNNFYRIFVAKIDTADGSIIWQKSWKANNNELANSEAIAYAIDVEANKVFIGGHIVNIDLLLVYDATNGDLLKVTKFDPYAGSGDKAYSVKATPDGNTVYLGGWTAKNFQDGFLCKLTNGGSTLAWYNYLDIPLASRIIDIDLDTNENVYILTDIHGTDTYFQIMKFDSSGNFIWERNFAKGNNNDKSNATVLKIIDDKIYVGGRVGLTDSYTYCDLQFGDGLFLVYDFDGNLLQRYFYFTGTTNELMAADWVKGFIKYNNKLYLGGSTYPRYDNYTGNWFIAPNKANQATINVTKATTLDAFVINEMGYDAGLTVPVSDFSGWVWEDITNPTATTNGSTQVYFWKLDFSTTNMNNSEMPKVTFYPNPASDVVYFTLAKNYDKVKVNIYDVVGKIVLSEEMNYSDIYKVNVRHLDKGAYFVNIMAKEEMISFRFVK